MVSPIRQWTWVETQQRTKYSDSSVVSCMKKVLDAHSQVNRTMQYEMCVNERLHVSAFFYQYLEFHIFTRKSSVEKCY